MTTENSGPMEGLCQGGGPRDRRRRPRRPSRQLLFLEDVSKVAPSRCTLGPSKCADGPSVSRLAPSFPLEGPILSRSAPPNFLFGSPRCASGPSKCALAPSLGRVSSPWGPAAPCGCLPSSRKPGGVPPLAVWTDKRERGEVGREIYQIVSF